MAAVVSGFVLLEVAFAILILGIVGTLGLTGYRAVCEHRAYSVTDQRLERAFAALAHYVRRTGALPCPASVDSKGASLDQGGMGCSPNIGTLPYVALGMSERDVQDGWNRHIVYAMEPNLHPAQMDIQTHGHVLGPFCEAESETLTITHNIGQPMSTHPAVVLISHGPTGPNTHDPSKAYNAAPTPDFVDQSDDSTFDDIVRFVSRDNLLAFYAQTSCPAS